jgi:alanyl-tRNA synthetase
MTERLYYSDPYCRTFDAVVTRAFERDGRPAVVLDRTAFYPTSGGQPFDTGRLGTVAVVDVIDDGDEVTHILAAPLAHGARVQGDIDWMRRFDHMQQHTGQHLLSAAFSRLFDNGTVSVHFGADTSTIDLARMPAPAELEQAVEETNRVVWDDRPVAIRFASEAERGDLLLRKVPIREGPLRLIEVAQFDLSACGGTHVARTGAVGLVAVLGAERFKGGGRVTFVCGGRALSALRTYRDAVMGAVQTLSVLPSELPAGVARLQAENKDLRRALQGAQEALAAHEGRRLRAEGENVSGCRVVARVLDAWDAQGLKALAAAITAEGGAAAALVSASPPSLVVVGRSADVQLDAGAVLKALTGRFGGRGGGRGDLAQGGGLAGVPEEIAAAARELISEALAG